MRPEASEQRRQKGNLSRFGTVAELDLGAKRCRVQTGEMLSDWVPWFVPRAGTTIEWSAPCVGEQGMLLSPDGDTIGAVFLRGIYSDSFDAPETGEHVHLVQFPDGTRIHYDDEAHALVIEVAQSGTVEITAHGGVTVNADGGATVNADTTINGDLQVNGDVGVSGKVAADGDVTAGSISLQHHLTTAVESGSSVSGPPQ